MRIAQDQRFRDQAERFALRFTCEDCALFDGPGGVCSQGYPEAEHRRVHYGDPSAELVFCKDFDLA